MSLSARFRTHTVTVRPYAGATPTGAEFGSPVEVVCRVEDETKMVLDASGSEVVSSARLFCDLDVTIPPESEVDVDGRTTRVISTAKHDTGGVSSLEHQEVMLQ